MKRASPGSASRKGVSGELAKLRARNEELEQVLRAASVGEVDALVAAGPSGPRLFTLKGAEHSYRFMVEAMTEGAATLGPQSDVLYCNPKFAEMIGKPSESIVGSAFRAHFAAECVSRLDELAMRARQAPASLPLELQHADGTAVPVNVALRTVGEDSDRNTIAIVSDLTTLRRAEAYRDQLAAIVEWASDAIYSCSRDGTVTSWNVAAESLFGYLAVEAIGRDIGFLVLDETKGEIHSLLQKVLMNETVAPFETVYRTKEGQRIEVSLVFSPILDNSGAVVGVSLAARDVTERNRLTRDLAMKSAILLAQQEASLDGILVLDRDRRPVAMNRRFRDLWEVPEGVDLTEEAMRGHARAMLANPEVMDTSVAVYEADPRNATQATLTLKEGRIVDIYTAPVVDSRDEILGRVFFFRDVTERKRAETRLLESEAQLFAALQIARAAHWSYDVARDRFTFNDNFYRIFHTRAEEVGGYEMSLADYARRFCHSDDVDVVAKQIRAAIETPDSDSRRETEHRILYATGRTGHIAVRFVVFKDETGRTIKTFGVSQDITERKLNEERLAVAAAIVQESPTMLFRWIPGDGWPVIYVSENIARLGYDAAEIMTKRTPFASLVEPDDAVRGANEADAYMASGASFFVQEYRMLTASGEPRWVEDHTTVTRDKDGTVTMVQGTVTDVTERKVAQDAQRATLKRLGRQLAAIGQIGASEAIATGDVERLAREVTETAAHAISCERANVWLYNAERTELRCIDLFETTPGRHSAGAVLKEREFGPEFQALKSARYVDASEPLTDPRTAGYVETYLKPLGITSMLDTVIRVDGLDIGLLCFEHLGKAHRWTEDEIAFGCQLADQLGFAHTSRVRLAMTQSLDRANRALLALSRTNEAIIHARNEADLYQKTCAAIVETRGYRMVWIGEEENDAARSVRPLAQAGMDNGYLVQAAVDWPDTEWGHDLTARAIRTGAVQVNPDFAADSSTRPWRAAPLERGYLSSIALPLVDRTGPFGALTIYAGQSDAFDDDERKLLEEIAENLSFGISALRGRIEHEQVLVKLQRSMEATIEVLANTVEARDPYTSGHQRRVAELARAIGMELGLAEDAVHGLYLAGIVHDVGKMHIPAEILSKPGKLAPLERQLVQTHAAQGYDILKKVEFPWPIAEMVRQHHERLDGSGYPQGLAAPQILPEAKILAVADVVESMMSHRPYRPALGFEAALAEIERGSGRIYEPVAVQACCELLRNGTFHFTEEK